MKQFNKYWPDALNGRFPELEEKLDSMNKLLPFNIRGLKMTEYSESINMLHTQTIQTLSDLESLQHKVFSYFNYPHYDIKTNTYNNFSRSK